MRKSRPTRLRRAVCALPRKKVLPFPAGCAILPFAAEKPADIRGISTVGRTSLPYCRPSGTLVNQGNPFKMKGNVTRPADVKRGKLPRKTSGNPYGALAQLVARDIRIVEVRGSTPLCSTQILADQRLQGFFMLILPKRTMQILHRYKWVAWRMRG